MLPPRRYAEKGLAKGVWRALNDLRDYVISITPTGGHGVKIQRTSRGVLIEADEAGAGDTRDDMIFVGDWTEDPEIPYNPQDVFIKDGTTYVTLELDPKPTETEKEDPATSDRYRAIGGGASTAARRFGIITVYDDYLECRTMAEDGTISSAGALYKIARPYWLQKTPYHNQLWRGWRLTYSSGSNNRRLTAETVSGITAGAVLDQELTPGYSAGDTIYATQPTGQTNVVVDGSRLTWLDINCDGRSWEAPLMMIEGCVNNIRSYVIVNGGPGF